jgi:preprotein translocase subunit SecA
MDFLKIEEGEAITHTMITKSIENAQKKVEAHNFDIRKHLIEYDDVMNKQREVIYSQRREILAGREIRESFLEMLDETVQDICSAYCIDKVQAREWDWPAIGEAVFKCFNMQFDLSEEMLGRLTPENFSTTLREQVLAIFQAKAAEIGDEDMDRLIKYFMLDAIDRQWKDHLLNIDHLKEGIGLRGYGQKDPKQEYKKEAYNLFMEMIIRIREEAVGSIFWVRLEQDAEIEELEEEQRSKKLVFDAAGDVDRPREPARSAKVAGRNDPCPCGSGKKYKKCHGK